MARQFREQLEQEVNSINAVQPVPRNVPPVTPATPGPEVAAAASTPTQVVDHPPAPEPTPAVQEAHPEAQIYFAMNGSEPGAATENPYGPQPESAAAPVAEQPEPATAPAAEPTADTPAEPASVKVIFPHDHG